MPLDYPIHQRTLGNGLRVVVSPDPSVPTVSVNLWVGVGSRHETAGRTGFAHLFEHLMFQGSQNVSSGEHFAAIMAQGGRLNATTWFDRTNYFETVPTGALELALWLEADRHGRLLDAVTQANLDNQRDVVKEEKRQRYDNQPYGNALPQMYAVTFPAGHPYHHPTIGSMEDLDAASLEDVHAFYRRHYGPNNTVLTLVGDITAERGVDLVEQYFGGLPPSAQPSPGTDPPLGPLVAPERVELREAVPNDRLHIAFRLPPDHTPEFYAASLALDVIGGLTISRLAHRLVRREHAANSVQAHSLGLVDGVSLGFVVVDVSDDADPDRVEDTVLEELERLADTGPTPAEMEAVEAQAERAWLSALAAHDERADLISHATMLFDHPGHVNTFLDTVRSVTPEQVHAAAGTWLRPEQRAVVAYRAEQEAAA